MNDTAITSYNSILPSVAGQYDLGSPTQPWRNIYVNNAQYDTITANNFVRNQTFTDGTNRYAFYNWNYQALPIVTIPGSILGSATWHNPYAYYGDLSGFTRVFVYDNTDTNITRLFQNFSAILCQIGYSYGSDGSGTTIVANLAADNINLSALIPTEQTFLVAPQQQPNNPTQLLTFPLIQNVHYNSSTTSLTLRMVSYDVNTYVNYTSYPVNWPHYSGYPPTPVHSAGAYAFFFGMV
jgi:hypothetical protein